MGGIRLTKKEKASGLKEIGGSVQPFMTWHDPETGQEFPRLPADAPNACNYMIRGFRMGPAPDDLREKWEAGAEDRRAEQSKALSRVNRSAEHKRLESQMGVDQPSPATTEETAAAVIKQLIDLGVVKIPETAETKTDEETEAGPEGGNAQLKLL